MNGACMLQIGSTLQGRYRIERSLGVGGAAEVFLAQHETLGTPVALKVLRVSSRSVERRLLQEARVQARMRSPHVVRVTDVFREDGRIVVVMEFASGGSLAPVLRLAPAGLTLEAWAEAATGLLHGLAVAHGAHIVHRDLKPENLLLSKEEASWLVQIADFGIAKALSEETADPMHTRAGVAMGTPAYMAPEQTEDTANVTQAADVFSAGTTIYALAVGAPPFLDASPEQTMHKVRELRPVPLSTMRQDIPEVLSAVVERAMSKLPTRRFRDAKEMLAAWEAALPDSLRRVRGHLAPAPQADRDPRAPSTMLTAEEDLDWFETMKDFMGFKRADVEALVSLKPLFDQAGPRITNRFYVRLVRQPATALMLQGRLERLKSLHRQWLSELFGGDYGESYLRRRMRIGEAHVRVRLAHHWLEASMAFLREAGVEAIRASGADEATISGQLAAYSKILDLDQLVIQRAYARARTEAIARYTGYPMDEIERIALGG